MENIDPMGVHTGESIVVAPSQTLNNHEYHKLREIGIKTIRHLGIIGECNIQYALDPHSDDYRVIEVNARLSRSSALASKATGYPLAHVAAKLALGYSLPELKNSVTGTTTACFEPALDYLALKIPRWDLDKFRKVSWEITTEMKSVGEIMALGRSFEEVMQKGLRMLQIGLHGFAANESLDFKGTEEELKHAIEVPTPRRMLAIAEALRQGWTTEKINKLSGIDHWFLDKLANIIQLEKELKTSKSVDRDLMDRSKKAGYSDHQIGSLRDKSEMQIRKTRLEMGVVPSVKQIDTLAAEYPSKTNYLYVTYHGTQDDIEPTTKKKKAIILGSGAYCIGSSVEFDWCCVNATRTFADEGYETIMINYNPETVSTDYDTCDKLYFDELSFERVLDIYEKENPEGVLISMGGQIPSILAMKLHNAKVKVFGTSPIDIDRAESRDKFSAMLDDLGIDQPKWREFALVEDAYSFADEVNYPVLVRPSYVLSGAAMRVAPNRESLEKYLAKAARISVDAPVVISKFEQGAKEIEIDAVAHKGELVIWAIAEHVENAGVHSGDATIVLPPQKLYLETIRRVKQIAKDIAKSLKITGPFNIQFLAKNNDVKVIECNLRASRSFPFSSKVTGHNFIEIATQAMLGKVKSAAYRKQHYRTLDLDHVGVKAPQFSFSRLKGADPVLGVEMASTGEVACFGRDLHEAFLKAMISVGFRLPEKSVLVSIGKIQDKVELLPTIKSLYTQGFEIYATEGTSDFLAEHNVPNTKAYKIGHKGTPALLDVINKRKVDFVINIPKNYSHEEMTDGYQMRRRAVDLNMPLVTNRQVTELVVECLARGTLEGLEIEPWSTYV
ncbi:MAG: carbamoyl-phosphate synthase (glutamine-hydrolyzing) large subunit, partial [Candidatus Peregrinibacteria bacterium]|nr:carbamoyl-phosphate synthase (glutamine-hydrolyzing) large subunit [Candidatus Peregrinibacteria bacterium]